MVGMPKNCKCVDSNSPLKPKIASLTGVTPLAANQQFYGCCCCRRRHNEGQSIFMLSLGDFDLSNYPTIHLPTYDEVKCQFCHLPLQSLKENSLFSPVLTVTCNNNNNKKTFLSLLCSTFYTFHASLGSSPPVLSVLPLAFPLSGDQWATLVCGCKQPLCSVAPCLPRRWVCVRQHESVPFGSSRLVSVLPHCHIDYPYGGHARPLPLQGLRQRWYQGAVWNAWLLRRGTTVNSLKPPVNAGHRLKLLVFVLHLHLQ